MQHSFHDYEQYQLALYDPVTGLPNIGLFIDRFQSALIFARREQFRVSLMLINIDVVEGSVAPLDAAHHSGLLREIGGRLVSSLRASDTAGRLDLRRFAVLLPHAHEEGIPTVASRIIGRLSEPFESNDREVNVKCSVGIAICTRYDMSVNQLCQQATEAQQQAWVNGEGFHIYDASEAAVFPLV